MIICYGEQKVDQDLTTLIGKIKAVIYARVSSETQAKKEYSLDSQVELCEKKAKKDFGYNDDEIIAFVEQGRMGDDPNRPALNNAMYLIENGVGKKFIMLHPDRLSRYLSLQTQLSQRVWNSGCDLEFVEFDVDPNNPESMLMYNIQGSIAQYNKAKILANSRRGRIQKIKKGQIAGGRYVYGYSFDKEKDILIENEQEKEVYLMMIDWLLNEGISVNQIAKRLSQKGIPSPSGSDIWYHQTILRILKNETPLGKWYYGKTKVEQKNGIKKQIKQPRDKWMSVNVPRYIDEEKYKLVQQKIKEGKKRNSGRPSYDYLLKGIAKCGRCGSAAGSGVTTKLKNGDVYKYYSCASKRKRGFKDGINISNCQGRNWRVDIVDDFVWGYISKRIMNPDFLIQDIIEDSSDNKKIEELNHKLEKINASINDKKNERKKYIKLFGSGIIETEQELNDIVSPLLEQIKNLEDEYQSIQNRINASNMKKDQLNQLSESLNYYREQIERGNLEQDVKRDIIQRFVGKVVLHEDNTIEIMTYWDVETEAYNEHKNMNNNQDHSASFYVYNQNQLQGHERDYPTVWKAYLNQLDKLKEMYCEDLLSLKEIETKTNIPEWIVDALFKANDVKNINIRQRAKMKRERLFKQFYKWHFEERLSLNEIYRRYGYSPAMVRRTFEDQGLKHLQYVN